MLTATLPVLMALSWVPMAALPATAPKADQSVQQSSGTITCPINGSEIPSCCCPLKK
jgi:hypothetical protein